MSGRDIEAYSSGNAENQVSRTDDTGDRVGGGPALPRTTSAMGRAGAVASPSAGASEGRTIKAEPRTLRFTAAPGEESPSATVLVSNSGNESFQIEDLRFDDGDRSGFVVYGIGTDVPAGGAVELLVAFRPDPRKSTSDRLRILGNGGVTCASVALRGKVVDADKAREARASAIVEQARQWKYPAPPKTYAAMLDALTAASDLMDGGDEQRPDPFDYTHARELSEPVVRELDEVASHERIAELKRRLDLNGMTKQVVDARIGSAKLAARTFMERAILGGSINGDYTLNQFRAGQEEILLLTGEKKVEGSELKRLDAVSDTALKGHLAVAGAPLAAGAAAGVVTTAPVVAAGSQTAFFTGGGTSLAGLRAWALANPQTSTALAEVAVGLGLTVGEGGIDGTLAQLENPEGVLFVLAQVFMDYAHVRGGMHADAAPPGARTPASATRAAPVADEDIPPRVAAPKTASEPGGAPGGERKGARSAAPRQSSSDLDVLYASAAEADVELRAITSAVASSTSGAAVFPPGLKGRARAAEKIAADYAGDASALVDISRSSIEYERMEDLREGLRLLSERVDVVRVKDRFSQPLSSGYRDMMLNVRMSNGHVCEVQLHLKRVLAVKHEEHVVYEQVRTIQGRAKQEGRDLTAAEAAEVRGLEEGSRQRYDAAYEASGGGQ